MHATTILKRNSLRLLVILSIFSSFAIFAGAAPKKKGGEPAKPESLYHRIGGQPAIDATVEVFYKKVLADKRVSHFFDGINMKKQRAKQKAFIAAVLGGPNPWKGKDLRRAHDSLDLNESHFNAIAENLQASLKEMKVDPKLIGEVMAIVASTKNDVLNR